MSIVVNAKIRSTMLGVEDHGVLTSWLDLDFGGSGQGFGGYCFDEPVFGPGGRDDPGSFKGRRGCAFGAEYIRRLLDTLEVSKWESLPGQVIRVRKTDEWGSIEAIGHVIKDRWFDAKALSAECFPERATGRAS